MGDRDSKLDLCGNCGKPLDGEGGTEKDGQALCRQCAIEKAEQYIREKPDAEPRRARFRETRTYRLLLLGLIAICVAVIAYRSQAVVSAFQETKPGRAGTYETDERTDRCIKNLWTQARLLQQGQPAGGPGFVCPASGKPYRVTMGPQPEVRCPNPEKHGFQEIYVTKDHPVPVLKR